MNKRIRRFRKRNKYYQRCKTINSIYKFCDKYTSSQNVSLIFLILESGMTERIILQKHYLENGKILLTLPYLNEKAGVYDINKIFGIESEKFIKTGIKLNKQSLLVIKECDISNMSDDLIIVDFKKDVLNFDFKYLKLENDFEIYGYRKLSKIFYSYFIKSNMYVTLESVYKILKYMILSEKMKVVNWYGGIMKLVVNEK